MEKRENKDGKLVRLAQSGDNDAMEQLCAEYKDTVRMLARPYFLIGADRDDLIQEGMIGLYKAVRDYEPGHDMSFRSFAELCIVRQIITAIKQATRKKHVPLNTYISFYKATDDENERTLIDTMPAARTDNPEELIISRESMTDMTKMLDTMLTPLEKNVLELFLEGRSYQEIAAVLGRGPKTVDNALQRIKKKLEAYIARAEKSLCLLLVKRRKIFQSHLLWLSPAFYWAAT